MHQSLPVAKTLASIVPHLSASCVVCEHAEEDHFHLFHECPLAGATWTQFLPSSTMHNYQLFFTLDWKEWIAFNLSDAVGLNRKIFFTVVCWHLWCFCNRCVFDQFFKVEQKILSWKPPAKPAFKLNIEVYHHEDRTYAI